MPVVWPISADNTRAELRSPIESKESRRFESTLLRQVVRDFRILCRRIENTAHVRESLKDSIARSYVCIKRLATVRTKCCMDTSPRSAVSTTFHLGRLVQDYLLVPLLGICNTPGTDCDVSNVLGNGLSLLFRCANGNRNRNRGPRSREKKETPTEVDAPAGVRSSPIATRLAWGPFITCGRLRTSSPSPRW
jgi:hypothetical protein